MKICEKLLTGVLVAIAAYAAWMTVTADRLRTELTTLRVAELRLQENHRQVKEEFTQLALNPATRNDAFRKLLAVLDAERGADLITPADPNASRVNKTPAEPTK